MKNHRIHLTMLAVLVLGVLLMGPTLAVDDPETVLYQKGNALCLQARWSDAIKVFQELLSKYPETRYADARFWMGYSLLETGSHRKGIAELTGFADNNPRNIYAPQALFKAGEATEKYLRDYGKAIALYGRVMKSYPDSNVSFRAAQNQAVIFEEKKADFKEAEKTYSKSKKLAMEQGVTPESAYITRANQRIRFIRENSDYDYRPLSLYTQAGNLEEQNRWNEALGLYNQILSKYPKARIADSAGYRKILCLLKTGDMARVKAESQSFLRKYPHSPHGTAVREILYRVNKQVENLERLLSRYFV